MLITNNFKGETEKYFGRVKELDPHNVGRHYRVSHSKDGREVNDIACLEQRLEDPDLKKDERRALHFTVGKYSFGSACPSTIITFL